MLTENRRSAKEKKQAFVNPLTPSWDIDLDPIPASGERQTCLLGKLLLLPLFHARLFLSLTDRPESCTFDDNHMCRWKNQLDDNFNWILWEKGTPSRLTGPSSGHGGKGKTLLT